MTFHCGCACANLPSCNPRWSAPLLTWAMQREGCVDNHQRIARVDRQDGLAMRQRRRMKLTRPRAPHAPPTIGGRWITYAIRWPRVGSFAASPSSMNARAQRWRSWPTRRSLPARRVGAGWHHAICDCGDCRVSECTTARNSWQSPLPDWSTARGIELMFIQPGKPNQHAPIESCNGLVRDECLNQHWFQSLGDARLTLPACQLLFNTGRRHGALATMPRAEFAATFAHPNRSCSPRTLTQRLDQPWQERRIQSCNSLLNATN